MKTLNKNTLQRGVMVSKILSSETRFKILYFLMENRDTDVCVKEIADEVGLTHSATSHQLARLQAQGIVTPSRKGQTMCYSLKNSSLTNQLALIIRNLRKN